MATVIGLREEGAHISEKMARKLKNRYEFVHLVQVKIRKPFARIPRDYCIFIFMFLGR
jgi:dihydroneopterin aldolase